MQFVAEYAARSQSEGAMQAHRAAHLNYRMQLPSLRLAMQVRSPAGAVTGSIILLDADTLEQAETIAQADPYITAGVFSLLSVRPVEVRFCNLKAGPS
jgi:uncharacterized protein